jgi:hypothetical protein
MIETGPVLKETVPASLLESGPVIKLARARTSPPLSSSRWRTMAPDTVRPVGWAIGDRERCAGACGDARRCMLREGHSGLHAWRSLGGLRIFEWSE